MQQFTITGLQQAHAASDESYLEFLRVPSLSMGLYVLEAGAADPQQPHREDEVYYILSGRGTLWVDGQEQLVEPGSIVYVAANVAHRFHSIQEQLQVLVFFAPVESA
jgi:mannose-6-phosphate isomerase-like protein (cupin superfamily)